MKTEEFNLGERRILVNNRDEYIYKVLFNCEDRYIYDEEDVQEFIKLLKEEMGIKLINGYSELLSHDEMCVEKCNCHLILPKMIDKLAGEKLI